MSRLIGLAVVFSICLLVPALVLGQGQVVVKGEDEQEFKHPLKTDTKGRLQSVQAQKLLDACDVKTGWTALSNDTTGIDEDLDHVEGSASLEFDKVDGTDNSVIGGCDKTLGAAVDIAHYMENNGFILVSINVSATTDIDYCFVRLGTDASNYNEWRVDDDALSVGWQQVRFPFYVPSTAGNLGNGIAATSVSYVAVGCAFDLETDTLADLRVDNLAVNTGFQTSADLQSQVATAAATPNVNVVKIASQPVDVGAGTVGPGTQRNTLASDDPAVTSLGIVDDWDEVHDGAVGTDGALQMGESKDFDGAVLPGVVDTEGDAARLSLSLYGTTYVMPVSEDGSETPLVAHDTPISAANGGSSGFMPMGESKDFDGVALPNVVDTEGDAVRPASSLYGVRYVMLVNEDGSAVGTILTSSEYLDDSGYTVTTDYVGAVGYIADTAAVDSVEEDDIGIPRMSLNRVPLGMIWDAGGNERGAHVTAGNAVEMDVAEQSLTALKVSKDANANTDTNRIWVKSDVDKVAGTATNVNGGNRDAGTPTVAIADDDPVAVSVAHLDKWDDGADRAKVNVEHDTALDGLDATAGWTVGNDATANIALSANHVRGTGSLTFDKVNGTNHTEAFIQKTITSVGIDDFETHNVIEWASYVSTLSDVVYVFVRIGTDGSNYSEWRVDDDDLTAGVWNPIAMFAGSVEYAVVGTGMNSTAITYIALGVSFDLEDDLLASIGVDDLMIHETNHTTSSISAEVATTVSTANVNLLKVGNKVVDKDIGVSGNGTQRVVNATDDPNLSKLTVEDLDTTGATDDKQAVAIVTQSAAGAVLNSAAAPLFTSGVSTGGTSSTQATGPTATDATPDLVLAAQDISQAASWGFTVFNNGGGGNPLTDADVQISRDGGATYTSLTWTACDGLVDTDDCDYDFPFNSYTHMRVYTTSAVGTSVTVQFSSLAR